MENHVCKHHARLFFSFLALSSEPRNFLQKMSLSLLRIYFKCPEVFESNSKELYFRDIEYRFMKILVSPLNDPCNDGDVMLLSNQPSNFSLKKQFKFTSHDFKFASKLEKLFSLHTFQLNLFSNSLLSDFKFEIKKHKNIFTFL